jgi:hypothetical protein
LRRDFSDLLCPFITPTFIVVLVVFVPLAGLVVFVVEVELPEVGFPEVELPEVELLD